MADVDHNDRCVGCGSALKRIDGPTHKYMMSSPACFALFNRLLACEYSDSSLQMTHRLTVDTFAVQHPGRGQQRREIQSVGLHLARIYLQLNRLRSPEQANDIMLGLGKHKATLVYLEPPTVFSMTVAEVADFAGTPLHARRVTEWAAAAWKDWSAHHDYITRWTDKWMSD
ncbi:DUF5946 family protein [Yoonia sp. SDW83-1]|uniref:DUF5946 family protein n=1 Tax=Yoonia sp. SDW83-1 TaxID=3366945 RepID=UPI00398C2A4B